MDQLAEPNGKSTKEVDDATSVERTLHLLDSEIDHIRSTQTQQGWTSWGLVGALVGMFWLLSDELKAGSAEFGIVALAIVLFSAGVDSLRWLIYQFWQWKSPAQQATRIRWSNEWFSGNELVFAVEILRSVAVLILAFFAPIWWPALSTFSIAYVWYLIMLIMWLALTRAEFPIRQGFTMKGFAFVMGFIVPALASFVLYSTLAPPPVGDVVSSYRVAGIIVFISYLLLSLAMVTKDSSVLHSLIAIRRDITLDRVDPRSAASQAEIALKGMEVSDAIQKDVSPILSLVERLNKSTNDLISQVQTMRTHLPTSGDTQDTVSAKIEILVAHRATCKGILTDRAATLAQLNSRFQQLMKRRQRIQAVMPEATDFFEQLDKGMKIILDESDLKFNEYQEQANKYDALLEDGLRAAKSPTNEHSPT